MALTPYFITVRTISPFLLFSMVLATSSPALTRKPIMFIDEYGCMAMEQTSFPGNIGDSAAESGRLEHLRMLLGDYVAVTNLENFVTELGYVRHPTAPPDWREKDFSGDQALPLFLAWRRGTNFTRAEQMLRRIKRDGWRTGNGDLVSPGFWAIMNDRNTLLVTTVAAQALLFKFPYRWSDSKKWFEKSEGSSGDYLNWIHLAVYCPRWIRRLVNAEVLKQKIREYYKPEPNSEWVIEKYDQVIARYWS